MLFICNDAQGNNIAPVALESGLNPNDYSFVWTLNSQPLSPNTTSISASTAGVYQLIDTPNNINCPRVFTFNVVSYTPIAPTTIGL